MPIIIRSVHIVIEIEFALIKSIIKCCQNLEIVNCG